MKSAFGWLLSLFARNSSGGTGPTADAGSTPATRLPVDPRDQEIIEWQGKELVSNPDPESRIIAAGLLALLNCTEPVTGMLIDSMKNEARSEVAIGIAFVLANSITSDPRKADYVRTRLREEYGRCRNQRVSDRVPPQAAVCYTLALAGDIAFLRDISAESMHPGAHPRQEVQRIQQAAIDGDEARIMQAIFRCERLGRAPNKQESQALFNRIRKQWEPPVWNDEKNPLGPFLDLLNVPGMPSYR